MSVAEELRWRRWRQATLGGKRGRRAEERLLAALLGRPCFDRPQNGHRPSCGIASYAPLSSITLFVTLWSRTRCIPFLEKTADPRSFWSMFREIVQWAVEWAGLRPIPQSGLPGSSGVSSNPAIKEFHDTYQQRMKSFERLSLTRQEIESVYLSEKAGLLSVSPSLDCVVEWTLDHHRTILRLETINAALAEFPADAVLFLRALVNDLVVGASLIPVQVSERVSRFESSFPFQMELHRRFSHTLCPRLFRRAIKELAVATNKKTQQITLTATTLFSHLSRQTYLQHSLLQRLVLLSLVNWNADVRAEILTDPLFCRIFTLPNLGAWMMSCSDADEQAYLNSCESAASNTGLVSHASLPAVLLAAGRRVASHIGTNRLRFLDTKSPAFFSLWPLSAPSVHEFVRRCVQRTEAAFADIAAEASDGRSVSCSLSMRLSFYRRKDANLTSSVANHLAALSEQRQPVSWAQLHNLTRRWSRAMQFLSSVYIPSAPVVLTRKLFSEWWSLSAYVVSAFCLLGSFIPGQPFLFARKHGAKAQYPTMLSLITFQLYANKPYFDDFAKRFIAEKASEGRRQMLDKLWETAMVMGGVCILSKEVLYRTRVTHLTFVMALVDQSRQRVFAIADPEINGWKLIYYPDMERFVADPLLCVELLDID